LAHSTLTGTFSPSQRAVGRRDLIHRRTEPHGRSPARPVHRRLGAAAHLPRVPRWAAAPKPGRPCGEIRPGRPLRSDVPDLGFRISYVAW